MQMLGTLLRELRHRRGLTQEGLAAQARVTARTIRYWEANQQQPHDVELESVLKALAVTAQERFQVLALLPDQRSIRGFQSGEAAGAVSASLLGALPGLGDLLRAIRVRRGWTQEQLAEAMRVSRATVIRWEATQHLPSEEDVLRLCRVLPSFPEEQAALQSRRLLPSVEAHPWTLEECAVQYQTLTRARGGDFAQIPLMDLSLLALKRQMRPLLKESAEALHLFAEIEALHGWWLLMQGRNAEASAVNWRVLKLARRALPPDMFCIAALNVLGAIELQKVRGLEKSMKLLYPWLQMLPASLHVWLLSDLAYYAGWAQRHEEAASLIARAEQAQSAMKEPEEVRQHLQLTKARVLLSASKPLEALDCLPPLSSGDGLIHELVIRAEMYLAARDKDAAALCLSKSQELLRLAPMPARQRTVEALGRQL